jgi:hypothetical protein
MREDGLTNTEAIRDKDIIIASEVMIPNPRGTKRIHSHPNPGHTNDRLSSRDQLPIPTSEQSGGGGKDHLPCLEQEDH